MKVHLSYAEAIEFIRKAKRFSEDTEISIGKKERSVPKPTPKPHDTTKEIKLMAQVKELIAVGMKGDAAHEIELYFAPDKCPDADLYVANWSQVCKFYFQYKRFPIIKDGKME